MFCFFGGGVWKSQMQQRAHSAMFRPRLCVCLVVFCHFVTFQVATWEILSRRYSPNSPGQERD